MGKKYFIDDTTGANTPPPVPASGASPRVRPAGAPAGGDDHQPPRDRVTPKPTAAASPYSALSAVPAFDRPRAVIILGPKPLPVTIVGGLPGGGTGDGVPKDPKEPAGRPLVARATDGFRMLGEMASGAGRTAAAVAQNSGAAAFSGAVSTASAGLSRLGPYGMAAAAGLQAASTGVTAFRDAVGAFTQRAREIGAYDGRIAAANAGADIRRLNSDIREAQKLGDKMGRLVDQQSKAEAMWDEILLVLKGPILEVLSFGLETANRTLVGMLEGINKLTGGLVPGLEDLIGDLKKIMAGSAGGDLDKLIREALAAPVGLTVPDPLGPPRPAPASLGIPLVGP